MRTLLLSALLLAASDTPSFELPGRHQKLLDDGKWDATPPSFRIIALSHLADGCVGEARAHPELKAEARACVESTLRRAKALPKSSHGLHLSHLNLIYGAADRLGACVDAAEHERLTRELAKRSLSDPLRHAASYDGVGLRWPADQTVTLASLGRFDTAHGTTLLQAPLDGWREVMSRHLDTATGLPKSELTGKGPGAKHPRGCAQSYLTRYLGEVDPQLAAKWWDAYREHFIVRLGGVVGFREWPRGVERKGDVDSGPIILGIGTAASAFGIAAAKSQGDLVLAGQLEASASAVMMTGAGGEVAKGVLAQAISFQGRWQSVTPSPPVGGEGRGEGRP
ncbi:MAG: hypothetical protein Q8L48_42645 [Archangium sp.]|nr:hypothetical protein [Archangium sp.]